MGEDSFRLNVREILSAVTGTQHSKHLELSRVPLFLGPPSKLHRPLRSRPLRKLS